MTEQLSSLAYRNFVETCRSPYTRRAYIFSLNYFMDYLKLPHDQYDKLLEKDPKLIQMDICDYVIFLRKKFSPATCSAYIAALNKFYAMNDITTLNWKKIHSFQPEKEKVAEDRPYTHSEIQILVEKTTPRNRAIILLLTSSGPRVGALETLRIKDIESIDKYNIYRLTYYPHSKKYRYYSFCTPEARKAIDDYLDFRKRWGERLDEDSPLFRNEYNAQTPMSKIQSITANTVKQFMPVLLRNVGIRGIPLETKERYNIMVCHGFRKFFETNAFKAGMDHMYLRRLMGQKSGLEDAYLKLSEEELLEGDSKHIGYIGVIDQLTINENNRLRKENHELKLKSEEINKVMTRLSELEQKVKWVGE